MKKVCTVILCLVCLICAIGFAACENGQPYYGTYHALNEDDEIIINDKGFTFGGTAYNYEDKGAYFLLTNYSGNTTKWYRYENDNVISPRVTFNFSTGNIPTRNGFFDATLTALDNRLNPTSVFYFTSYGEYQLVFPNAPALSEKGTYWLEDGLLKLNGRYQLSNKQTTTQYYIDENFNIHVYAYVKDLSLFKRTVDDATYTPTAPNEPTTPTEPVHNYELTYTFDSALEGYIVSGYKGTINGSVEIPSSYKNIPVVSIGNDAFRYCSGLTDIIIPNSIVNIKWGAFYNCSSLTTVNIPNGVISIEGDAFRDCASLTSVTISNSVTNIGGATFCDCPSLKNISLPNSITEITSSMFYNCISLSNITIPNSVTKIGSCAFSGCTLLTNITIPNSVSTIESSVFENCKKLYSITIPESITTLGYSYSRLNLFSNCENLKTIYFDSAYAANYADLADTLPEYATDIYILTSIEPTLSVYTIVYEKQDGTVINDGKEYYHYKIKE